MVSPGACEDQTMSIFKNLFGRSDPPRANLDNLFAVPSAAITLEASAGFTPTGTAAVCYREAEGTAFAATEQELKELLGGVAGPSVERSRDDFGFDWLQCRRDPDELAELVTDVHAVNSALEQAGFGPSLLCSLVGFTDTSGRKLGLIYLYKSGTFYPFAPEGDQRRDNALELQVRGILADDLTIERDLNKWLAVWGAPGL
jgi:hypothetical protein